MAQRQKTQRGFSGSFDTQTLEGPHWIGIALAAITGAIHLYLFFTEDFLLFLLAGLGFFGAIVLLLLGFRRRTLYVVGVLYTLAQIAGYLLMPLGPLWIGVVDKIVQVGLIGTLVYLYRTDDRARW